MDILDNHLIYAFELKQTTQKKAHINELKFPGGMKTVRLLQLDHEDLLQTMISSDNKPCVQLSDALAVFFTKQVCWRYRIRHRLLQLYTIQWI